MNSLNRKPTLNQLSTLQMLIKQDKTLEKHFYFDDEIIWDNLAKIKTESEYKYVSSLIINGKRFDLNRKLVELGFKRKNLN